MGIGKSISPTSHYTGYGLMDNQEILFKHPTNQEYNKFNFIYVGMFKDGKKEGKGMMFNESCSFAGIWENGYLRGPCNMVMNGFDYEGTMVTYITDEEKLRGCEIVEITGFGRVQLSDNSKFIGAYSGNAPYFGCLIKDNGTTIKELNMGQTRIIGTDAKHIEFAGNFMKITSRPYKKTKFIEYTLQLSNGIREKYVHDAKLLNSCFYEFPLSCILKNINEAPVNVVNDLDADQILIEEVKDETNVTIQRYSNSNYLHTKLSEFSQFPDTIFIMEHSEIKLLEYINYSNCTHSFKICMNDQTTQPYHLKLSTAMGTVSALESIWDEKLQRALEQNHFENFVPHQYRGIENYPDVHKHMIFAAFINPNLGNQMIFEKISLQEIKEKQAGRTLMPAFIDEWLDPRYFMDKQSMNIDRFTNIVNAFRELAFLLCEFEKYGVYHGNIRPKHIWFNGENLKLIDFSHALIFDSQGTYKDAHTYHHSDIASVNQNIEFHLVEGENIPHDVHHSAYYYCFDYYNNSSDNAFLPYKEKYRLYNNKFLYEKQYSLFRRDSVAYAMSFLSCLVKYLKSNNAKNIENVEKYWRKLSLLDELSSKVNNKAKILRDKLIVYGGKLNRELKLYFSSVSQDAREIDILLQLCFAIIPNLKISGNNANYADLTGFDKKTTDYMLKLLTTKKLEKSSFKSFASIGAYLRGNRMESILFENH